jgi:hypothetical protein
LTCAEAKNRSLLVPVFAFMGSINGKVAVENAVQEAHAPQAASL